VNTDRQRARMARAIRVMPITVSSAPVRNHHRIGLGRARLVKAREPCRSAGPPGGLQTIKLRRCDRILITASYPAGRPTPLVLGADPIVRSPFFRPETVVPRRRPTGHRAYAHREDTPRRGREGNPCPTRR
jgi:hypothetical protein